MKCPNCGATMQRIKTYTGNKDSWCCPNCGQGKARISFKRKPKQERKDS